MNRKIVMSNGLMNKVINANALEALKRLPDAYCQTCVTSPPYYNLRDYETDGQIGLEPTPELYIENLVKVFREVRRVLKDDGTLWVNIGDSYAGSMKGRNKDGVYNTKSQHQQSAHQTKSLLRATPTGQGLKRKDLIGIPWMLAFALRADGWYLRTDIIWQKPNAMPESVKDRPVRAHEYVFLLSKSPHYYYDAEAVKEPAVGVNNAPVAGSLGSLKPNARRRGDSRILRGGGAYTSNRAYINSAAVERESHKNKPNERGKRNQRSVWTIATRPYKEGSHLATFPEDLVRPCILAGSKMGDVVLDPFAGSGTTGAVALQEGRGFIGIEINPDYCEIIKNRLDATKAALSHPMN